MSKQFQFARPIEYDPSLAAHASIQLQSQTHRTTKVDELKDQFGFEESEDSENEEPRHTQEKKKKLVDSGSDVDESDRIVDRSSSNNSIRSPNGGAGRSPSFRTSSSSAHHAAELARLESLHAEEMDRLARELTQAHAARSEAEEASKATMQRMEELATMAKQAKNVLVTKYKQQLKSLQLQIEEQKTMLQDDDEVMESLRESNLKYECGETESARTIIDNKLKEWRQSRGDQYEKVELLTRVDELTNELSNVKNEIETIKQESAQSLQKAQAEVVAAKQAANKAAAVAAVSVSNSTQASSSSSAASAAEVVTLTHELALARTSISRLEDDLKKLHENTTTKEDEHKKLIKKLAKITQVSQERVLQELDEEYRSPAVAPLAPTIVPVSNGSNNAELASLDAKVRSLESQLVRASSDAKASSTEIAELRDSLQRKQVELDRVNEDLVQTKREVMATKETLTMKEATASNVASERETELKSFITKLQATLQDRDAELTSVKVKSQEQLTLAANEREAQFKSQITQLESTVTQRETELNDVKEKAKEKLLTASNAIKKLKTEYSTLRTTYMSVKEQLNAGQPTTKLMLENLPKRRAILTKMLNQTTATKSTLSSIKSEIDMMIQTEFKAIIPALTSSIQQFAASRTNESQHLREALKKEMTARKTLFNQIQEMKGNIRVYCRVRPPNERERADNENSEVITFPTEGEMTILNPEKKIQHSFEFEKIFDPTKVQSDVFNEVSDLVVSVLDGYNVCIFAYGQTGAGKTWTMTGSPSDPGVNIRSLTKLFEVASERAPDIQYEISCSLLEVYNEKIQDLLGEKGRVLKAVQGQYGMEVQDLTMVRVSTEKEVLETLKRGTKNRSVSATAMNDVSSRSHLILSTYVKAKNQITGKETMGKMHLIDLAGSERVSRSGVTGEAMKEAQAINQSLSALGNVIAARANKAAHVPYRDSTLTYLLQDSLEKNSKTLMFVQVSPAKNDASESICSLKFAERVRKVELGKSEVNTKKK